MKWALVTMILINEIPSYSQIDQLDLRSIANKSLVEVEAVVGKSTKVETFNSGDPQCCCKIFYFLQNKLIIVFIDNEADWITAYVPLQLTNMETVRVMAFHKDSEKSILKLKTTRNNGCCPPKIP